MGSFIIKSSITIVAIALVMLRILRPDIKVDTTVVELMVIALVPWLASVLALKGVELPGGFKFEFREPKESKESAAKQLQSSPTPAPKAHSALSERSDLIDGYLMKLIKLTPIESIIAYLIIERLTSQIHAHRVEIEWGVAILFLLVTIVLLRRLRVSTDQIVITTVGFAVWVAAIGGPLTYYAWYQPVYGALALLIFAYGAPLIPIR